MRERLGLPEWEPGDGNEQHRALAPAFVDKWDLAAINKEADEMRRTEEDLERIERAQRLWNECVDPRGTAAEAYLNSRALTLYDDIAGSVLRFHPRTPWRNEDTGNTDRIPCLVAAFTSIDDDVVTAVHRIRVDMPGRWPKTERRMLGVVHRSAIKLAPAGDELLIAEGLETAMSPREAEMTLPCWAVGSVGAVSFFPVLDGVKKLVIAIESGAASTRSTKLCRRRYHIASRKTSTLRSTVGSDLNDALMTRKKAASQ
ncbi:toprim domain-containing protein [Bradyrhizobium sp. Tv2a-2]|uniref:DUF7146 domain-containing protein n=1 Tax=Bradyrhizobium sp. Tv2a-2 TaxID=113395 RepID=UPI0003FF0088|nr:toprim domain-containing protein [Bradyrhizobium sp. Tv2a-2]